MMACFTHNDINMLLNFHFWQPVYYFLDPEDQSFGVKSKEKRARWAGIDKKIGAKMCYKFVDDESGKIVYQSVIISATEPGTSNLHIDPIKPLPPDVIHSTEPEAMIDELMTMINLNTPLLHINEKDPIDLIPASSKSKPGKR